MASHHCSDLLFLLSGVPLLISQWHLTTVVTCFSFFRGASPDLAMASHHCSDLLFLLSGVPLLFLQRRQLPALLTLVNNFIAGSVLPPNVCEGALPCTTVATCFSFFPGYQGNKATCVALFSSLRCLSPPCNTGKATYPSYSYLFRCFSSFLPALKATCVALFPSLRCLSPPHNARKATYPSYSYLFRCFSSFLPALKATYFPNFPWQVTFIRNFWLLPAPAQVLRT